MAKLIEKGWALQPSVINKGINLGTTNAHKIDLDLKVQSRKVMSPMQCLASLEILAEL